MHFRENSRRVGALRPRVASRTLHRGDAKCYNTGVKLGSADVYIGPAGWSYPDWEGLVYPARRPGRFDFLAYLASFFNLIEVNSTFYRIPAKTMCASWARRVAHLPDFRFSVKLFQDFTHRPKRASESDLDAFKDAVEPLHAAGRMTAVLVQFPWSFRHSADSARYVARLVTKIAPYPCAVEVRHGSWACEEARSFFEAHDIGTCGIDQPLIGDSLGADDFVTDGAGAYFRLHGRNYAEWFKAGTNRDRRYDYLYTPEELEEWVARIRRIAERVSKVHVVLNNHFEGQAVANALAIDAMLQGKPVASPGRIKDRYTSLSRFLETDPGGAGGAQGSLFEDG